MMSEDRLVAETDNASVAEHAQSGDIIAAPAPAPTQYFTAMRSLFVMTLQKGVQLQPEIFAGADDTDTIGSVIKILSKVGLRGKMLSRCKWSDLVAIEHTLPVIALQKSGYWVVIESVVNGPDGPSLGILNPREEKAGVTLRHRSEFISDWSGVLILCAPAERVVEERRPFSLAWFLPEIIRHKRYLGAVAMVSTVSSLIIFSTPLMFQILIDKVMTHRSYQTLTSLMLIFGILTLFDAVFTYVRHSLMLFVTNKIDANLASRTFRHLLRLPLVFFETRTAGVLTRHMQQTEAIRNFLTGRLFTALIDASTLPLLLVVLFLYSAHLTLVVLLFSAAIAAVIAVMVPSFQRRLEQLYNAEGNRQAQLVETLHGMRTVKSLALEAMRMVSWDNAVARSVRQRASVMKMAISATVLTQTLDKTMQVTVLCWGAVEVFSGSITLGALIAFNMVAGRVTGPLVQIVGLINQYQETALAVKMLATVMEHPPERDPAEVGLSPIITGRVEFDRVTFRYPSMASAVLDRLSFAVDEGQVIGIVGRSGSGKTTVTRLMQGIYTAGEGTIRLNGVDIRHIDLSHLRRSIGVVLQDNFLFRGTISDNIAVARPDAGLAEILEAARMAGAEEFIDRLPRSYETWVEEGGANFSGGQRQRLAIARALLTRPRLLIFDEATSALDPESESIIQHNLAEIARGRTLIIVSHRLTSLTQSDAILMLDQGRMLDMAPHAILLERCESYRALWQQQTQNII